MAELPNVAITSVFCMAMRFVRMPERANVTIQPEMHAIRGINHEEVAHDRETTGAHPSRPRLKPCQ